MSTLASARVRMVVEVQLSDAWGKDCSIGQVYAQAAQSAIEAVQKRLSGDGEAGRFRVFEASAVDVVLHCEGKP